MKLITVNADGSNPEIQDVPNDFPSVQARIDWCVERSEGNHITIAGDNLTEPVKKEPFDPVSPAGEYRLFAFNGILMATNIV